MCFITESPVGKLASGSTVDVTKECHTYRLSEVHRTASLLCREGCTGSIFLSVQYEECKDFDAIESTRAKVRSPAPFGPL